MKIFFFIENVFCENKYSFEYNNTYEGYTYIVINKYLSTIDIYDLIYVHIL